VRVLICYSTVAQFMTLVHQLPDDTLTMQATDTHEERLAAMDAFYDDEGACMLAHVNIVRDGWRIPARTLVLAPVIGLDDATRAQLAYRADRAS
jgi:hypothetical protein